MTPRRASSGGVPGFRGDRTGSETQGRCSKNGAGPGRFFGGAGPPREILSERDIGPSLCHRGVSGGAEGSRPPKKRFARTVGGVTLAASCSRVPSRDRRSL